jgi:hypothetical protein
MVCKKNISDLYWFRLKNALCPVGEESCIISHRSACSRGYKRVREGGDPRSQDVSEVYGFLLLSFFLFFSWKGPCPLLL